MCVIPSRRSFRTSGSSLLLLIYLLLSSDFYPTVYASTTRARFEKRDNVGFDFFFSPPYKIVYGILSRKLLFFSFIAFVFGLHDRRRCARVRTRTLHRFGLFVIYARVLLKRSNLYLRFSNRETTTLYSERPRRFG